MYIKLTKFIFFTFLLLFISCVNPKQLPVVREDILAIEKERTKKTNDAISKSKKLQEVNSLCDSVPLMEGFSLVYQDMHLKNRQALSFAYYSEVNFSDAEKFYKDYFMRNSWKLVEKGGISSDYFIFEKEQYKVGIYYVDSGDGVNYLKECEELNISR